MSSSLIILLYTYIGPIFRLGSNFVPEAEKVTWTGMSDSAKIRALLRGKYNRLGYELALLLFGILYFIYLRLTITGIMTEDCLYI